MFTVIVVCMINKSLLNSGSYKSRVSALLVEVPMCMLVCKSTHTFCNNAYSLCNSTNTFCKSACTFRIRRPNKIQDIPRNTSDLFAPCGRPYIYIYYHIISTWYKVCCYMTQDINEYTNTHTNDR